MRELADLLLKTCGTLASTEPWKTAHTGINKWQNEIGYVD